MLTFNALWRRLLLASGLGLALAQTACAHPVAVQPSVVISSQIGHAPVYAQIGIPAPMVMMPPPRVVYAPPPRVFYAPPGHGPAPGWGHAYGHRHGHKGHGHAEGGRHRWGH